jgi:hypothetical protein
MREHRLNYSSPAGDVASCVVTVLTCHIPKLGPGFTIASIDTPIGRTFPAGVARIDSNYQHLGRFDLIGDKADAKLAEALVMQTLPLLLEIPWFSCFWNRFCLPLIWRRRRLAYLAW